MHAHLTISLDFVLNPRSFPALQTSRTLTKKGLVNAILGNTAALSIPAQDGRTRVRIITETSLNTFQSIWGVTVAAVVEGALEVGVEVEEVRFQGGVG